MAHRNPDATENIGGHRTIASYPALVGKTILANVTFCQHALQQFIDG